MSKTTIQSKGSIAFLPAMTVVGKAIIGASNAEKAFNEVELKLGTMKGRKFYGVLYGEPENGEYFACVQMNKDDSAGGLGLEVRTIPSGMYARRKVRYWCEDIFAIGKGFGQLFKTYAFDPSRPTVEYYRSERDVHIFLPIRQ